AKLKQRLKKSVVPEGSRWLDTAKDVFDTGDEGMYGPDLFDLARPMDPPPFLKGYQHKKLPTDHYAAFLERLSLTRDAPSAKDLTLPKLTEFRDARAKKLGRRK